MAMLPCGCIDQRLSQQVEIWPARELHGAKRRASNWLDGLARLKSKIYSRSPLESNLELSTSHNEDTFESTSFHHSPSATSDLPASVSLRIAFSSRFHLAQQ